MYPRNREVFLCSSVDFFCELKICLDFKHFEDNASQVEIWNQNQSTNDVLGYHPPGRTPQQ